MRPKEYYDQFTIQEDARYIFTLMPPDFEKQYETYIKAPIESIVIEAGKVKCGSHLDFEPGNDRVDEVWRNIQKASVIIANITGFKPDVMLEVGVTLMKKGRVILIAEKSLESKANLPFNIANLGVEFYEPSKLSEFSDRLKTVVERWITPEEPKIKDPRVIKLMNDVLGLRREEKYDAALLLFESMDKIEPGNWFIYKEWGITYKKSSDYENATGRLLKALEFTRANRNKSEIYTELGIVYRENNMAHEAQTSFEKAENLDRDNADLYEKWAFLFYQLGKFNDAMNKMMEAVKLDQNNKVYKWKFEFYSKKFLDSTFKMGLGPFLKMKRDEGTGPQRSPYNRQARAENTFTGNRRSDNNPSFTPPPNDPAIFDRFTNRHKPKEEVYGEIVHVDPGRGIYVRLDLNIVGLIWSKKLPNNFDANEKFRVGNKIRVILLWFNNDKNQIDLGFVDER